jgi:hypothetical protein
MSMIQNGQFCVHHTGLCRTADAAPNGGSVCLAAPVIAGSVPSSGYLARRCQSGMMGEPAMAAAEVTTGPWREVSCRRLAPTP